MAQLSLLQGVRVVNFDQCQRGAHAVKPTRLIYFGVAFSSLFARCQHGIGARRILRGQDARGGHRTKAAAAYPRELRFALARLITARGRKELPSLTGEPKERP
eukprot:8693224-Alexandrium_andersonii.AAC.1